MDVVVCYDVAGVWASSRLWSSGELTWVMQLEVSYMVMSYWICRIFGKAALWVIQSAVLDVVVTAFWFVLGLLCGVCSALLLPVELRHFQRAEAPRSTQRLLNHLHCLPCLGNYYQVLGFGSRPFEVAWRHKWDAVWGWVVWANYEEGFVEM